MSSRTERWANALDPKNPLKPEDTLAYYETLSVDPTVTLTERQKFLANKWMDSTENASTAPNEIELSNRDKAYLASLNSKANSLPANDAFVTPIGFLDSISAAYDRLYVRVKGWNKNFSPVVSERQA